MHAHSDNKSAPISPLLRIGGTLIGSLFGALLAAILFFLAALFDTIGADVTFQNFLTTFTFGGAFFGFFLPRHTLNSRWFFFPEIFDKP
jgi:hypothetical protein